MQIDTTSLLIGIVIGAVIAFLTRIETLKSLSLKLDKIGIGLGVEGFDKKEPSTGVSVGDISDSTLGDIAGRDINKNSYMYKVIQSAAKDAVKLVLAGSRKEDNSNNVRLQRIIRIESRTQSSKLKTKLRNISSSNKDWLNDYYSEYFASSDLLNDIEQQKSKLAQEGWRLIIVRPVDNINDGVLVELVAEKLF